MFQLFWKETELQLLAAEVGLDQVHVTRQEAESMVAALAPFITRALALKGMGMDPKHRRQRRRSLTHVLPRSHQKCAKEQQGQT